MLKESKIDLAERAKFGRVKLSRFDRSVSECPNFTAELASILRKYNYEPTIQQFGRIWESASRDIRQREKRSFAIHGVPFY